MNEVDGARGNVARNDRVCKLLREQPYIPEFLSNIKAVPRPKLCAGTKFDYYLFVRGIQLGIYLSFGFDCLDCPFGGWFVTRSTLLG